MNRGGIWTDVDAVRIYDSAFLRFTLHGSSVPYLLFLVQVSVRKVEEWGTNDLINLTPAYLELVPTIAALGKRATAPPTSLAGDLPPPSLIIAIEHDSPKEDSNWREMSMSRGLQVGFMCLSRFPISMAADPVWTYTGCLFRWFSGRLLVM